MDGALLAALFLLALVLRLVPLLFSPLPYNVDGFALTKIASDFGATGHWSLNASDPNAADLKLPAFSLFWHAVVGLGGLNPLPDIQWVLPVVTSTIVLPVCLIGVLLTGRRSVGAAAGLFLAVFGSFLFLTSVVMKESLALVFVPAIVLLFHGRADPRKRILAVVLLLLLGLLHHVTLLVTTGMLGTLILLAHARDLSLGRLSPRRLALDVASGLGPFGVGMAYYEAVGLGTIPQALDDFVLFLALVVLLGVLLVRAWRPAIARRGRRPAVTSGRVLLVPALVVAGVLVNARTDVFAGTLETQVALLELLPALLFLAALAVVGYVVVRRTANRASDLVLALAVAPIAFALFGFLRGLDSFSFRIEYRSFDFLDYAFALLAGIGTVAIAARLRAHRGARVVLAAAFFAALLATTPMAWNTQAVFGVNNVTTPAEFQALSVLASLGAKHVATDQRMAAVGAWWFGLEGDRSLPYALQDGGVVPRADYALVLERWTAVGAQEFPGANVPVSAASLQAFLAANRVVYVTGGPGDRIFVVQLTGLPIT